jgi:molybdate transport system ATP-binding protein
LSALNVLPGVVQAVREGAGPGAIVAVDTMAGRVLARITRRAAAALALAPGAEVHVVVKAVSVAQADVGAAG